MCHKIKKNVQEKVCVITKDIWIKINLENIDFKVNKWWN